MKFFPVSVKGSGSSDESDLGEGTSGGGLILGSATDGGLEMGGANGNSGNIKLCF